MDIEKAKERLKNKLENDKGYIEECNPFSDIVNEVITDNKAIGTVLSELEKKDRIINLMALAILNYDDQLVINKYKDIDDVKETFEEFYKVEREGK